MSHLAPARSILPDLLSRVRAGDPDALAALYAEHAAPLLALAYRVTGSAADAEDVLHDVFLGLPEALRRYEERGAFPGWLKRLTARTALMLIRRPERARSSALDAERLQGPSAPAEALADRIAIDAALATLSPALRAVFVLKMIEGFSHAEIAELLGIRVGTSEVRLARAVAHIRTFLRSKA